MPFICKKKPENTQTPVKTSFLVDYERLVLPAIEVLLHVGSCRLSSSAGLGCEHVSTM